MPGRKMNPTRIDWADSTWNPVWGCTFGCPYCYARGTAKRFGMQVAGRDDFVPTWIERNFAREFPARPSRIFVNSMSDIADWAREWIEKVLTRIEASPEHSFLFLTKRPEIYQHWEWPRNAWLGVTSTGGIPALAPDHPESGPAFVSIEPLLGPLEALDFGFDWAILGAESGRRAGKVAPERSWIDAIVEDCRAKSIAVFMKSSLEPIMGPDMVREFPGATR